MTVRICVVDGAAEADADARESARVDARPLEQLGDRRDDLPANAVGRRRRTSTLPRHSAGERAVAGADAELQFGAADFDAEEHAGYK